MGRRRKKNSSCLRTMMTVPLLPFLFVISCAKDYKPYNSKSAKISRAKKKKWF